MTTSAVLGPEPEGATPLDEDERDDLIPQFVATRADLDVVEFENITKALPWAFDEARRGGPQRVLDHSFLFALHKAMFKDVWRWAGTQRHRVTNIGVDPSQIATQTRHALNDGAFWHSNAVFEVDERAARLHQRLVAVHPFPNGNGRCTRLLSDLFLTSVDAERFSWASGSRLDRDGDERRAYLAALRVADGGDYGPLVAFARS